MPMQIDKNVPLPEPQSQRGGSAKYPWREMEVGDSFFVPGIKTQKFGPAIVQASKRTGFKFTSRSVEGGVRVWRIA